MGTAAIEEQTSTILQPDGAKVELRRWSPTSAPRAVLVVAHGMGEHADRYRAPLAPLIADGITVYAYDHRGHGAAARASATVGDFGPTGFAGVLGDLLTVVGVARSENPTIPLVLLGHSMGSMIAQAFVLDHADCIDALVLSGSAAVDIVAARGAENPDLFGAMNAPFEPGATGFEWLSRDRVEVERYVTDPLCGFSLQAESMKELFGQGAVLADAGRLAALPKQMPIWIVSGDADPLNDMLGALQPLIERYRAAGLAVESRKYPGARHEILNETNRGEVMADLAQFIDRVIRDHVSRGDRAPP